MHAYAVLLACVRNLGRDRDHLCGRQPGWDRRGTDQLNFAAYPASELH